MKTNIVFSKKEKLFRKHLIHSKIKQVNGAGLMLAVELSSFDEVQSVMEYCKSKDLIVDWFLFNNYSLRISPPLIIEDEQIIWSTKIILEALDQL